MYITGTFYGTLSSVPELISSNTWESYVIKYSTAEEVLWVKKLPMGNVSVNGESYFAGNFQISDTP